MSDNLDYDNLLKLIKNKDYNIAIKDLKICIKNKPTNHILWERLGFCLYKLKKYNNALIAYTKAYQLTNYPIYEDMINNMKSLISNDDTEDEEDDIIDKISSDKFQNRLLELQKNPFEIFNDKDVMNVLDSIAKKLKL
jgi:tetratricopeptide (TPR) repeat protein